MTKKIYIKGLNLSFTFRHKWDERSKKMWGYEFKRKYCLGVWYNCPKILVKGGTLGSEKKENTTTQHMIGIDLLVCKAWITADYRGYHLKINNDTN